MSIERRTTNSPISTDGNKLKGLCSPVFDGSSGTQYELWEDTVERFAEGAFADHLKTAPDVVALFNHDSNQILGRTPNTLKVHSDARGLHYEIDLGETQAAKDLRISVARGDVKGSSFAFVPQQVEWLREGTLDVRVIQKATIHDVSPCTMPAYSGSSCGLRSADERKSIEAERDAHHARLNTEKWQDRISKL